ncbi:MAG: chorismate-binding protein [Waddliaceae bacterium]
MHLFQEEQFLKRGAIFSLSNDKIWVGWGEESQEGPAIYSPDFFLKGTNDWHRYKGYKEMDLGSLSSQLTDPEKNYHPNFSLEGLELFESTIASFKGQTRLKKIVPYLFLVSTSKLNVSGLIQSLLDQIKGSEYFVYGAWDETGGILGATPEVLFQKESCYLKTMAVAGTSDSSKECDLLNQPKDMYEHSLVVEGITKSLNAIENEAQVNIHKRQVVPFSSLSHLVTPIDVRYSRSYPLETYVRALHPTPALGAFPKDEGAPWLRDYDQYLPRHRFGAPFGLVRDNSAHCLVAIRNIQWKKDKIKIGAGCGVVHESVLDNELKEVKLKLHSTKKMLGLI